ncbi:MAG: AI-2E family transporter, partial [Candidatus Gracilibacteria bacterium]|nr:AI-2E family transporter [Candidatus Gracilibacteria bacterium]
IDMLGRIKKNIKTYFLIKAFVSFLTAVLSYIVMKIFGLDFALFWSMLIFFLNFIPNIGSIIAVFFPIVLSLIQYDTIYPFIFISAFLVGIQVLIGNIVEPKFMGNKLNLSPLVILISLGFWASIWGIVGMMLCVPLMVIINIILAQFESTRGLAILMSKNGEIEVSNDNKNNISKNELLENVIHKIEILKKIKK